LIPVLDRVVELLLLHLLNVIRYDQLFISVLGKTPVKPLSLAHSPLQDGTCLHKWFRIPVNQVVLASKVSEFPLKLPDSLALDVSLLFEQAVEFKLHLLSFATLSRSILIDEV
jgi:hypothetical protein